MAVMGSSGSLAAGVSIVSITRYFQPIGRGVLCGRSHWFACLAIPTAGRYTHLFSGKRVAMRAKRSGVLVCGVLVLGSTGWAQAANACGNLTSLRIPGVEIVKAEMAPVGNAAPLPQGWPGYTGPLPAHCRVDGVINRRKGADGEEFGIGFAVALPEGWNGDFLMQGGGGGNGYVSQPIGSAAAGDKPGLTRGFAVASTDTGHKAKTGPFDFSFMRDEQAMLDFAYLANAEVAGVAKQIIAQYYGKAAAYSYFAGCSTGGREGMILSQRYPTVFNGIISGDPAMDTGFSNLAASRWSVVNWNQIAPKDASGKPITAEAFTDADRKLMHDVLLKQCDAKDGVADGMIFDPMDCDFDPAMVACKAGQSDGCIAPEKAAAIERVFAGPKDLHGDNVYPGFLYDTGITYTAPIPGLLAMRGGFLGMPVTDTKMDVDKEAAAAAQPLVDSISTNLTTFSANGGKLIFYHGDSDPWFSPLDTLDYYKKMAAANGGLDKVEQWSQIYLVPGMSHCGGGGAALDDFDMLGALANWVEKRTAPESVVATGKAFPGRSRPLCAYPKHAQYRGFGNAEDAANFECR
jgi:feruloyl esterase